MALAAAPGARAADVAPAAPAPAVPAAEAAMPAPPVAPAAAPIAHSVRVPEGTQVRVRLEEPLSSATSTTGDVFSITTDEPITLADGTVIPAGYRGKGEVSAAEKNGMMGKAGQLNIRLNYVSIGAVHMHLRATKGAEGANAVTSTVVLTVLFGPIGLLKHGHNVVIPKGQTLVGYVDGDTDIVLPVAPPPLRE